MKSVYVSLNNVKQTEYFTGFLKSSPKILIRFINDNNNNNVNGDVSNNGWTCSICSFVNAPSQSTSLRCELCGVLNQLSSTVSMNSLNNSSDINNYNNEDSDGISCPACTFLNHPSMLRCEICDTQLTNSDFVNGSKNNVNEVNEYNNNYDNNNYDDNDNDYQVLRISFRRDGDSRFYQCLKLSLSAKAWLNDTEDTSNRLKNTAGIGGVIQSVDSNAQYTHDDIQTSFKDLDTLMIKAKEMVNFAETLALKLPKNLDEASEFEKEASLFLNSSFTKLGLQYSNRNENVNHKEERQSYEYLANELKDLLLSAPYGLMHSDERGLIGLDEVWCGWNRYRGVALLTPNTLLETIGYVEKTTQLKIYEFKSGLCILHKPSHSIESFTSYLKTYCYEHAYISLVEFSNNLKLPVRLSNEILEEIESQGHLVRDEDVHSGNINWYLNEITNYYLNKINK